ncbi:acylphosphatase [Natronoglycomyces albus]|uniref:acylphosphatase n=1 Tax=Natronoglycomyces albus TaxID=2811108 RepID=A0A895XG19_9ACTN|nr:acylphosphatase [Natronoglycomyces albus]QSB04811.1 acylphosphatase [Natronoglycomyces albus]
MNSKNLNEGGIEIVAARAMLISDPENEGTPIAVANLQAVTSEGDLLAFGQAPLRLPLHAFHYSRQSWDVVQSMLDELIGKQLTAGNANSIDAIVEPALARLKRQAQQASHDLPGQPRSAYEKIRRAARDSVNSLLRIRAQLDPHLHPEKLVGISAIRAALTGLVELAAGAKSGESNAGQWYTGDLNDFYEKHIEHFAHYACSPQPPLPQINGDVANSFDDVEFIGHLPKDGTKGHLLEREALRYGMNSARFPNGTFIASDENGNQLNFKWGRSPIASGVSLSICTYKEATRRLLERVDVPVPRGRVFAAGEFEKALDYADRIGYPVVCKPVAGLRGIGVIANIGSREELVRAFELYSKSQLGDDDFVIEQHVAGEDYRIVVIGGEVVAAVVREAAAVTGDGIHTVIDLAEYKNRLRKLNPHLRSRPIVFSDAMKFQLEQQGLTFGSIPDKGQVVTLANSANLSQGGDSFEVAHELHPSIVETAIKAVDAVPGLGFCGLDMLIEDHKKPISQQQATVIELNAHAAIGSAQYPMWGVPTPVAKLFFEQCAKEYGIELPEKQLDHLSLKLVVEGKVKGVGYRRWIRKYATEFGVNGTVENTEENQVTIYLDGPADPVSALVYLASRGSRNAIPTSVDATHVDRFEGTGFEIIW